MSEIASATATTSEAVERAIEEAVSGLGQSESARSGMLTDEERVSVRGALTDLAVYIRAPGSVRPPSIVRMSTWR